jgi:hypothetical protein
MREWIIGSLEVACVLLIAVGVALVVGSVSGLVAGVGCGLVVAGAGFAVLVYAAQLPAGPTKGER